jgi:hypothetical protein
MKLDYFMAIVFTILGIAAFAVRIPEASAVGVFVMLLAFFAWANIMEKLDKQKQATNGTGKTTSTTVGTEAG